MSFQNLVVRQALKSLHKKATREFPNVDCIRITQAKDQIGTVSYYEKKKEIFLANYNFGNFAQSFKILLGEKGIKIDEILSIDLFIYYSIAIQTDCTIQYIENEKTYLQKISFVW